VSDINKSIDEYFNLQEQIYKYFDYVEDWCVFPMEDKRSLYWIISDDIVFYCDRPLTIQIMVDEDYYSAVIYKQRFLNKWVYRAENLTMVLADTQVDGNKFLMIFDNEKEIVDKNVIEEI
jgi:hypothetical protein